MDRYHSNRKSGSRHELEAIVKRAARRYIPLGGLVAFHTPIHEALHAGFAHILPSINCTGGVLNNSTLMSEIMPYITLGYFKAEALPADIGGYAVIQNSPTLMGNISSAIVSGIPEVATLAGGLYFLKVAMANIKEKGRRTYAAAMAYAGLVLTSHSFSYLNSSALSPAEGKDHTNFTASIMNLFLIPEGMSKYATFAGAAAMGIASLWIAAKLPGASSNTRRGPYQGYSAERVEAGKRQSWLPSFS